MRAVNLVPADSRPGRINGGKSGGAMYGVLGALVVLLLGMSVLAQSKSKEAEANQQLAAVEQSTQAYSQIATEFSSFESAAAQANQRINTVRGLADARFDWAGSMRDLSRIIPKNTQLLTLNASVKEGLGSGGGSSLRSAIPSPAIAMTGCSSNQDSVADLVANLQAMRRVTNVTLEYSQREDSAPLNCRVAKEPYTFSIVVFLAAGDAQASTDAVPGSTPAGATPISSESSGGTAPTTPTTTAAGG